MFYFNIGHYCNAKFKLCLKSKIEHTASKFISIIFFFHALLYMNVIFSLENCVHFGGFMCCAFVKK